MAAKSMIIDLEEMSQELHRILENMQSDNDDQVVAYYGELQPIADKLDGIIDEIKGDKKGK
jgi:hypothetical protein